MVSITSSSPLGADISTAELQAGSVTYAKLGTDLFKRDLIETLSPSGVTTITTTGTLTAYDYYLIEYNVVLASADTLKMRINADTGSNYSFYIWTNTTPSLSSGQTLIDLSATDTTHRASGLIWLTGKTVAVASGTLSYAQIGGRKSGSGAITMIDGIWTGGNNTQITSFTFLTTPNFTGTIKVYGVS